MMFRFTIPVFLVVYLTCSVQGKVGVTKKATGVGGAVKELVHAFAVYGRERSIIVTNKAHDWLRVWCSSKDDSTGEIRLNPGESMGFNFKPHVVGGKETLFWCTTDYKTFWARWDAFGPHAPFSYDRRDDRHYIYEIRHDGVYYTGHKIRGLTSGKNRYQLWEHYDQNKNPLGASLTGFVDDGMCNNIPGWMERKTSAVTVCDGQCVILYSDLHCTGQTSRLHPGGGCTNFWLSHFNDKAKSVKGC